MYGLPRGAFEQIVDNRDNEQFLVVLLEVQEAFIGVDNLFQVGHLIGEERKVVVVVIGVVQVFDQLYFDGTIEVERSENTS